ncbi:uncharacterized protein TEOVI_000019700 [Trypanosoma equiperdum]|uniref:Uncharacterized protein n=2 Tax=Trypanozoon TaxID=39700 RepID=A0A1G4I1E6_TRYEQ|nr:hypothetical protein DPX39_050045700 [Trypanosoma brucei equiperdum]SCU65472.1 hypothetical protein, conserved [Trypanosoma equiperdum]
MQSSCMRRCLSALQLYVLEQRKTVMSYKYVEDAVGVKAAFNRLSAEDVALLENKAEALRHDIALQSILYSNTPPTEDEMNYIENENDEDSDEVVTF